MIYCIIPPAYFLTDQKVIPTLGILRVATYLKHQGYSVKVLDLSGIDDWKKYLEDNVEDVEVFAITSTSPQVSVVSQICSFLKDKWNKKIILGGPHATMTYASYKHHSNFRSQKAYDQLLQMADTIVIGDGELSIIQAIHSNEKIIDVESSKDLFLTNDVYNSLPMIDRDLIDIHSYSFSIDGKKATSLISQMGCPYECNFCGGRLTKTYHKVRNRSTDMILKEVDVLYRKYGYEAFMFYDDELNINNRLFVDLLEKLIKYQEDNHISFNLRGFTRSDLLTDEQAKLMYRAGFRWLLIGFESGSSRMLFNMNKKTTVEDNTRSMDIARKNGLKVKALMSIGHPGESIYTIRETKDWMQKIKPDDFDCTIISVYPGTPYYDEAYYENNLWVYVNKKNGDKLYSDDIDYLKDVNCYKTGKDGYKSFVYTDFLTKEQLVHERKQFEMEMRS